MSSHVLNFNKPCSACRRRKVRCDKAQPCNNCIRHRVTCVYEAPESIMSQQQLQDRVGRLEHMVEDLAAYSLSNPGSSHYQRSSLSANNTFSSFNDYNDISADIGNQVSNCGNSDYIGSESWMNVDQLVPAQQYLLNMFSPDTKEEHPAWLISMSQPKPKDLSRFHLPMYKEDIMLRLFFDNIEPWIRINHQQYLWQLVSDFRQGTCLASREVEALIFSTQYITTALLPATLIYEKLGLVKPELVLHLQQGTELAFDQANIMRSRSVLLVSALLYYITCQFHTGNCEMGSTLLGLATSIARRMGMHRDPAYSGYTPWCIEIRRRMWGHLATLDAQSYNADGSESVLMSMGDMQRSFNVNDADWKPPRYIQGETGPRDREGYSEATASLIRREICRAAHSVSEARRTAANCYDLMAIIGETTKYIRLKFLYHFDCSDPMQHIITKWCNAMIKSLTVSVLCLHALTSKRLYNDCLACLEEFSHGEKAATRYHWQWVFRWPMPLHVIASLLSCLANLPDHRETDRAWEQIDAVFRRYNNDDVTMAKVPAWYTIELLCDQAVILHPNQKHEGRAYMKRMHAQQPPVPGAAEIHSTEIHHKAGVGLAVPCAGDYGIEIYDDTLKKQSLAEVASAEAMSLRFSDSEIDAASFNINADDDFLSIDI
ncbi:hypothetical protein B0T10DRAFT_410917 [Thelonectria olida]|uniref:Zn(2)-C6 fungal-type domain-containing protein n=1 Tax=Thelonectria olida TaxID=1576542 RepID=A0A9P8VX45_9HYPO|nr:hypothetical protein B0T10DRAFT_410917 [Thelonectria olida]